MSDRVLTAIDDRIFGETPEDGMVARVYGDPVLAKKMAAAEQMLDALKYVSEGGCCCDMRIGNPMVKSHSPQCNAVLAAVIAAEGAPE